MKNEFMNIVIVGHVDHGKSTVIGRLLADTNSLPEGKLEQIKVNCENNSKPFEYAFLLDALKEEQSQGITIDSARVFFKTSKRNYIIIDAPGHIEFLKNMVTGAARAEAAVLVIDAKDGVQENSRRHGYMLSMLGIKQVVILINKMDLVDYKKDIFNKLVKEYREFLSQIDMEAICFIPVSGRKGDMIVDRNDNLSWYKGETLLDTLDRFKKEVDVEDKPFRMPIQDVYKFTKYHDDRRIIAGNIETGSINVGDDVVFYPSGKKNTVETVEIFNSPKLENVGAGAAVGFTLKEQSYLKRGEIMTRVGEKSPEVTTRINVNLFWLGKQSMIMGREYILKLGTARVPVRLEKIEKVINASTLSEKEIGVKIQRHDVVECTLKLSQALAFDEISSIASTSRFVIVDKHDICGGGIIRQALKDNKSSIRESVLMRNLKWIKSNISHEQRAENYGQKAVLILITGDKETQRKEIGKCLEQKLFKKGRLVYFLAIGSVIHGLDSDLKNDPETRSEHFRRLSEVVNILLDTGIILIVTSIGMTQEDLDTIKIAIDSEEIMTFWVGDKGSTNINFDLNIKSDETVQRAANKIDKLLKDLKFYS